MSDAPTPVLNMVSPAFRRATAAGFVFMSPRLHWEPLHRLLYARISFECVCGRVEFAQFALDELRMPSGWNHSSRFVDLTAPGLMIIDFAGLLEDFGAFSADHLRQDGYTDTEIQRIREPWDGPTSKLRNEPCNSSN